MYSCYAFAVVPNGFDYNKFDFQTNEKKGFQEYHELSESLTFVISGRTKNSPTIRVSQHKSKWNAVISAIASVKAGEEYQCRGGWLDTISKKGYVLNEQEINFVFDHLLPAKQKHSELFFNFLSDDDCLVVEETESLKQAIAMESEWHTHIHLTGIWADMKVKHFHSGS